MAETGSLEELHDFSERAKFPSHGLILSTLPRVEERQIRKGIQTRHALDATFHDLRGLSHHTTIWVETDMRASLNPTDQGSRPWLHSLRTHRNGRQTRRIAPV